MADDPRLAIVNRYLKELEPINTTPLVIDRRPPGSFRAILFDIYGTMLTSKPVTDEQRVKAIADICLDVFPDVTPPTTSQCYDIKNRFYQQLTHSYAGLDIRGGRRGEVDFRNVWSQVLQKELSLDSSGDYLQQVELFAFLYAVRTHRTWPQPNLRKTITGLAEKKIPIGVISNSQFYTPLIVNHFLGCPVTFSSATIPYFDQFLTFYSFQHGYVKPDDYFFVEAKNYLKDLAIEAKDTLYVGNDYRNDIDTANRNGLRSVLYAGDQTTCRKNHPTATPDFVITDLSQLLS